MKQYTAYRAFILDPETMSSKLILSNGKLGYLTPVNNEKKLALKIIDVFNNYGDAKKKAQIALKYLNRFELNSQCQKYERLPAYPGPARSAFEILWPP